MRRPDAGTISVLGLDPQRNWDQSREQVGMQLQEGAVPEKLRVGETVDRYASFYRQPADGDELLDVNPRLRSAPGPTKPADAGRFASQGTAATARGGQL
jgi:hypothetical protein